MISAKGATLKAVPLAAALAALSLAACEGAHRAGGMAGGGGDARLCVPFPATSASTTPATPAAAAAIPATAPPAAADPAVAMEDCLHRWGYALAESSDDASQVAAATVAACGPSLARWNQQTVASDDRRGEPREAPSLLTGQPTTPIAEHFVFAQGRALFYVVQARAGRCAAPPMANGVPVGVTD